MTMPQHPREGPLGARFDGVQGVTELREARAASRGNAVLASKTPFPSACASGFEAIGDTPSARKPEAMGDAPSAGKPEARAEGMRVAARRRLVVCLTDALGTARTAAEPRESRAVSRGNAGPGCKTPFPSACASGFEAIGDTPSAGKPEAMGDTPSAGKPEARAEGINDSTSPNPRSHSPGFAATGNDRS
jgi:hypothetical protein